MEKFINYSDVLKCKNIKMRELIICTCNFCKKDYQTTKERIIKNKKIICSKCKREKTNLLRYGVKVVNCFGTEEYKSSLTKKYGKSNPQQVECIKEKTQQTNYHKYGFKSASKNATIKQKIKRTNIHKYGFSSPSQNKLIKKKQISTFKKNHNGYNSLWAIPEYQLKNRRTLKFSSYIYKDIIFDSSWELCYYIYCVDHNKNIIREPKSIIYYIKDKIHRYYPDFEVDGVLVEIKSNFILRKEPIEKMNCIKKHKVKLITNCKKYIKYVNTFYGKNFIKECKYAKRNLCF